MRIFIIGGGARCGKTTFGKYLSEELKRYGYRPCVMHLTEPLYAYARNYFEWDGNEHEKPREFLQKMGIEIIKNKLHKNYFLFDRLCEDIEILENFFDTFIITDARLIMEFREMKKRYDNVISIHLTRENYDDGLSNDERSHVTETELALFDEYDYEIVNQGLGTLKRSAEEIVKNEERGGINA